VPRVDFYVLEGDGGGRQLLACRLIEKASTLGHRIYVHTASPAEAARLDDLLWTFRAGSFVPHATLPGEAPVRIGHQGPPADGADVLVNLTASVPEFIDRFERVVELVGTEATDKEQARERFRDYRGRGLEPTTHNLTP